MADGYERLPEWFWHPTHGLYGHEEPARPGDRTLYVRVDDAAGSPPPTPAPTRELVEMLGAAGELSVAARKAMLRGSESCRANATTLFALAESYKTVMALLSAEPTPPLWAGETDVPAIFPEIDEITTSELRVQLPGPPGTAVVVREKRP